MSSAIISGVGKLNSDTISSDNELKINIIELAIEAGFRSQLVFLSHNKVTNFSEFVEVLNYYNNKRRNLFTISGEYKTDSSTSYEPVLIYYGDNLKKDIRLMYKNSFTSLATKIIANLEEPPPTNWSFYNI